MASDRPTLCPSAQPDWDSSRVIGVVGGTPELLELAAPVQPAEVFRFAAPCATCHCGHFDDKRAQCRLAEKVLRWAPVVVDALPACGIHADCRWWQQEGRAACMRCPQVVTLNPKSSEALHNAANPELT